MRSRGWVVRSAALAGATAVVGALLGVLPAQAAPSARPTGARVAASGHRGGGSAATPLIDHGGTVLASSTTYDIWWGPSGFPSDAESAIPLELAGFSGSSYLGIAGQYMRQAPISTSYANAPVFDLSAPPSASPKVQTIVNEVAKYFPHPAAGSVFFVYVPNKPSGANFCGWHSYGTVGGVPVQVAYILNWASGCDPLLAKNLSANTLSAGTRAFADTTAHEFMESITDPTISAWYDKNGQEIGDKCNFVYSAPVLLTNGTQWQIQEEWSNALGSCQQQ